MADDESAVVARELLDGALALSDALSRFQLPYALIGGLAAGYRTHPRFTRDVDFLLAVPQLTLPRLLEDLADLGFAFDERTAIREWTQEHMTVLSYHGIRIDWLKPMIPAYQH